MTQLITYLFTDSLCHTHPWFVHILHSDGSATFLGWGSRGWRLWPRNSNLVEIFVHCTYPPSFIILCLIIQKLSCLQQTHNRWRWKHPPCFAMLCHCIIV